MVILVRKRASEFFAVKLRERSTTIDTVNCSEQFGPLIEVFIDIFGNKFPNKLPSKRELDFEINLKSDEPPPVRPVIRHSSEKMKELKNNSKHFWTKGLFSHHHLHMVLQFTL